jgi:hypothetical protein
VKLLDKVFLLNNARLSAGEHPDQILCPLCKVLGNGPKFANQGAVELSIHGAQNLEGITFQTALSELPQNTG